MKQLPTILRRALLLLGLLAALTAFALAADATAATAGEFYEALEENLRAQTGAFSIAYTGDKSDLDLTFDWSLGDALRNMSARSPDGPDNADYPALNVEDGTMACQDGVYSFEIKYLATQEQINEVSRRAAEIVDSFALSGENDVTKVKLLYEYICTHYTYDDTLTKFSAYDGLTTGSMVCQGYALLTYKVMWNAGIPCRIVTGTSSGENHAWNIVKVDGRWYNIDTTWDAASEIGGVMNWDFFLKNTTDFYDHTRFYSYLTDAYQEAHPMAEKSISMPRVTVLVNGSTVTNLVVRAGIEVQLEAVLSDGTDAEFQWSTENPELLTVTADGRVLANGLGSTVITVRVEGNRGILAAQVPVEAVELRTASPWAQEIVTEFYLNQLLPFTLCSDFQQPLTRAELARLCYQFVLQQTGWGEMVFYNPYEDLDDCPDTMAILRCRSIGLMNGTSATTFSPDAPVTREQAAVVLVRLMEYLDGTDYVVEVGTNSYDDARAISSWAEPYVNAATERGVLEGMGGSFHPQSFMTREQMIVALSRVYAAPDAQAAAA